MEARDRWFVAADAVAKRARRLPTMAPLALVACVTVGLGGMMRYFSMSGDQADWGIFSYRCCLSLRSSSGHCSTGRRRPGRGICSPPRRARSSSAICSPFAAMASGCDLRSRSPTLPTCSATRSWRPVLRSSSSGGTPEPDRLADRCAGDRLCRRAGPVARLRAACPRFITGGSMVETAIGGLSHWRCDAGRCRRISLALGPDMGPGSFAARGLAAARAGGRRGLLRRLGPSWRRREKLGRCALAAQLPGSRHGRTGAIDAAPRPACSRGCGTPRRQPHRARDSLGEFPPSPWSRGRWPVMWIHWR